MGVKLLAVVICAIGSCSLLDVKIGSQTIKGSVTSSSASGGGCGDAKGAFKDVELAGGDLLKGNDFDVNVACVKSAKFTVTATLDPITAGEACTVAGPSGVVALNSYDLTYDYKEGGATKSEKVSFACPDTSVDFSAPLADIQAKITACIDVINSTGQSQLRQAINRHADKLKIAGVGTCDPAACFNVKTNFTMKLENGVVSVGGTCD
jgi:hypothetical protein